MKKLVIIFSLIYGFDPMLDTFTIQELIRSIEKVGGKILIPDPESNWLWDALNHQYFPIDESDRALIQECLENKQVICEIKKKSGSGTAEYAENIYIPVVPDNGHSPLIIRMSVDVTKRVRSEKELFTERNKLAYITEHSPDAIIILDERHAIRSWNRGAVCLFGYRPDDFIGHPINRLFFVENEFAKTIEILESTQSGQELITNRMTRCRDREGHTLHCQMTVFTMSPDGDGRKEFVVILRDMTKQKQLEDEIARSIDNITKINEISSFIHSSLDMEEILNMILVAVTAGQGFKFNRAFLFLISDDRTMLEGKKAIGPSNAFEAGILWHELNLKNPTLRDILSSYRSTQDGRDFRVNQMIADLKIPLIEYGHEMDIHEYAAFVDAVYDDRCILISHDKPKYLTPTVRRIFEVDQLAVIPLSSKDGVNGALVVDNAITGRPIYPQELHSLKMFANQISAAIQNAVAHDTLQNSMLQLQRLHESLQKSQQQIIRNEKLAVVGAMSAKLAHEIRNPMVAIGGFARRILNGKYFPENERFLKIILAEAERMEGILNATLSLSQTKEPKKALQSLMPAVNRAVAVIGQRFEKYPIRVHYDIAEHLPDIAYDFDMIVQALINIMVNAAESMPGGGILGIALNPHEEVLQLIVSDTGEGMDEMQIKKIFDPFYTTKERGSGLGLIVVMDFLDRHGFKYTIDSQKGKGTKFIIDFR